MDLQKQYDSAMFDYSQDNYASAVAKLKRILEVDPVHFDAQLSLGMALYRQGDFSAAITEGHKAEQLRPLEQLVHTNLSLFYMKHGDRVKAEHHGLQARIASWREDAARARASGAPPPPDPALEMAKPQQNLPKKFPDMPWKKKPPVGGGDDGAHQG